VAPQQLPRELPLSAQLMVQRLEGLIAGCLAAALGAETTDAIRPLRREGNIDHLAPFGNDEPIVALVFSVTEPGRPAWAIEMAFPYDTLATLFANGQRPPASGDHAPADPREAPFADVPLPLSAVLVDIRLPLAAISALEVGQILPVPVARAVPLCVGGRPSAAAPWARWTIAWRSSFHRFSRISFLGFSQCPFNRAASISSRMSTCASPSSSGEPR
jgi:flagellar motor switch protein FliM